jgi:hypothetical protein
MTVVAIQFKYPCLFIRLKEKLPRRDFMDKGRLSDFMCYPIHTIPPYILLCCISLLSLFDFTVKCKGKIMKLLYLLGHEAPFDVYTKNGTVVCQDFIAYVCSGF